MNIQTQLVRSPANRSLLTKVKAAIGRSKASESKKFFNALSKHLAPVTDSAPISVLQAFDAKLESQDYSGALEEAEVIAESAGYSLDFPHFDGAEDVDPKHIDDLREATKDILPHLDMERQVIRDAITRFDEAAEAKDFALAMECARKLFSFAEEDTSVLERIVKAAAETTTSAALGGTSSYALGSVAGNTGDEDDELEDQDEEDWDEDDENEGLSEDDEEDGEEEEDDDNDSDDEEDGDDEDYDDEDGDEDESVDEDEAFADYEEVIEQARNGKVHLPGDFTGSRTGREFAVARGGVVVEGGLNFLRAVGIKGGKVHPDAMIQAAVAEQDEASMLPKDGSSQNKRDRYWANAAVRGHRKYPILRGKQSNAATRMYAKAAATQGRVHDKAVGRKYEADSSIAATAITDEEIEALVAEIRDDADLTAEQKRAMAEELVDTIAQRVEEEYEFDAEAFVEACVKESDTVEEGLSRKHFQAVADLIRGHKGSPAMKRTLAQQHAAIFKQSNPRFDHGRFMKACGISEAEEEQETDDTTESEAGNVWLQRAKWKAQAASKGGTAKYVVQMTGGPEFKNYAVMDKAGADDAEKSGKGKVVYSFGTTSHPLSNEATTLQFPSAQLEEFRTVAARLGVPDDAPTVVNADEKCIHVEVESGLVESIIEAFPDAKPVEVEA